MLFTIIAIVVIAYLATLVYRPYVAEELADCKNILAGYFSKHGWVSVIGDSVKEAFRDVGVAALSLLQALLLIFTPFVVIPLCLLSLILKGHRK